MKQFKNLAVFVGALLGVMTILTAISVTASAAVTINVPLEKVEADEGTYKSCSYKMIEDLGSVSDLKPIQLFEQGPNGYVAAAYIIKVDDFTGRAYLNTNFTRYALTDATCKQSIQVLLLK